MRKTGFALAMIATIAMTVVPVAPSFAAAPAPKSAEQKFVDHARRGDIAILSTAQMRAIAQSNPKLHAKLMRAYETSTVPRLTAAEKKYVRDVTQKNLATFKAGDGSGWIIVAVVAIVLLILWQPVVCKIFPWAIGCVPYHPVRAR
jgi:hypothetical protein